MNVAASPVEVAEPIIEKAPLTVLLRLEKRGRRSISESYYEVQVMAPVDSTLESLSPYGLHKSWQGFGGATIVKRTYFQVEQYDPKERTLLVSHSVPASKGIDFELELEYGHDFKQVSALGATAR